MKKVSLSLYIILIFVLFNFTAGQEPAFDSYHGLVMTGYQAWFNAPGDGSDRGWKHWGRSGRFDDTHCTVDFWPEVSEYEKTYATGFEFEDGSTARVFSSYDYSTVDLHFKWMQEYDIDGAFMQRFVHNLDNSKTKNHYMVTVDHGMKAAVKYNRAISIRYDISGIDDQGAEMLLDDFADLRAKYNDFNRADNPTFLYHNGKPLIAVGGVGFADNGYSADVGYLKEGKAIIDELIRLDYSIMIRVPNKWRLQTGGQALPPEDTAAFFELIRRCDIVMPWHVGAYTQETYYSNDWAGVIAGDIQWCCENELDYVPVLYPGFSWYNLKGTDVSFKPRNRGSFFWMQVEGALAGGAEMFFLAQFDEVDEGTQYFKCTVGSNVPVGNESVFQSYEDSSSQYLVWARKASIAIDTANTGCWVTNVRNHNPYASFIKIFPNPSNGFFTIESPSGFNEIKYQIFNARGGITRQGTSANPLSRIDMSNEEKGAYFITVNAGNQVEPRRLILK